MQDVSKGRHPDERRIVTVLFVDLTGFTELMQRLDPEAVTEHINRYFDVVTDAVNTYGGFVDKFIGDAVMALFGAPKATEADPERAVRTALEIVARVKGLSRVGLEPVRVHIGIETGPVVAGYMGSAIRKEYTVMGEAVNLAARIQAAAGPDQILVGPAAHSRTASQFSYAARGTYKLKGKDEEVLLHEPNGIIPAPAAGLRPAELIGRDLELTELHEKLQQASAGETQAVVVAGEAGIGKTHLIGAFLSRLAPSTRVATSLCDPIGVTAPLSPIVDVLVSLWGLSPSSPDLATDLQGIASRYGLDPAPLLDLWGLDPADEWYKSLPSLSKKERRTTAVRRSLSATPDTTVVVIDDIHWADAATLELVEKLVTAPDQASVLLVLISRPGLQPSWINHPPVSLLKLEPLTEASSRSLVRSLVTTTRDSELEDEIIRRTGGNALFITELARSLRYVVNSEATSSSGTATVHIPDSIHDVVAARIDRLPDSMRGTLQVASVIGQQFSVAVVEAVTPDGDLAADLAGLLAREFITPVSGRSDVFEFTHALTRDVAYETLLVRTRRLLHARIAEALESSADRDEASPKLAHHLAASGAVERALAEWAAIAGANIDRSANADAIATVEHALAYVPGLDNPDREELWELRLRTMLGAALMATEGPGSKRVEATYLRARDLARGTSDADQHFPVLFGLFRFFLLRARLTESGELSAEMLRIARGTGDVDMLLEARFAAGSTSFWRGELETARTHFVELVEQAQNTDEADHIRRFGQNPVSIALAYLGWTHWLMGDESAALEVARHAEKRTRSLAHPFSNTYAYLGIAILAQLRGDVAEVRRHVDSAAGLAEEFEFKYFATMAALVGAWLDARTGDPAEAADRFAALLPLLYATGARVNETFYGLLQADVCLQAGRITDGIVAVDRALAASEESGEVVWAHRLHLAREALLDEQRRRGEPTQRTSP